MKNQNRKQLLEAYKERKIVGGICAIKNTANGKMFLSGVTDLQGSKNRFEFSQATGSCVDFKLQKDWDKFGKEVFIFEVLEELEKGETQTSKEFSDDIKTLKEMWLEKVDPNNLY